VAFLLAIGAFLGGRWLLSGIALAVAGAFHVNYLVLGIGAFGFAQLLLGARGLVRRGALQLALPLGVLALNLPVLLDVASAPGAAESARIFMFIRAPHHYLPRGYLHELVPFVAWQVAGLALWPLAGLTEPARRTVRALWAALALPVLAATVINVVTFVPRISQLFPWRLAPYAVLLAQLVACTACVRWLRHPASGAPVRRPRAPLLRGIVAAAAVGVVIAYRVTHQGYRLGGNLVSTLALAGVLVVVVVAVVLAPRLPAVAVRWGLAAAVVVGMAAPVRSGWRSVYQTSTLVRGEGILREAGLYRWARTTPAGTRFLIPPNLGEFRLRTLRAVVVDWKSTPVRPDELIEWHRRIEAVAGRRVESLGDAVRGYAAMDPARLEGLERRYGADYVVLRTRDTAAVTRLVHRYPVALADSAYTVLELRATSSRERRGGAVPGPETFMEHAAARETRVDVTHVTLPCPLRAESFATFYGLRPDEIRPAAVRLPPGPADVQARALAALARFQ
jgi:hypothetical protein